MSEQSNDLGAPDLTEPADLPPPPTGDQVDPPPPLTWEEYLEKIRQEGSGDAGMPEDPPEG